MEYKYRVVEENSKLTIKHNNFGETSLVISLCVTLIGYRYLLNLTNV